MQRDRFDTPACSRLTALRSIRRRLRHTQSPQPSASAQAAPCIRICPDSNTPAVAPDLNQGAAYLAATGQAGVSTDPTVTATVNLGRSYTARGLTEALYVTVTTTLAGTPVPILPADQARRFIGLQSQELINVAFDASQFDPVTQRGWVTVDDWIIFTDDVWGIWVTYPLLAIQPSTSCTFQCWIERYLNYKPPTLG